MEFAVGLTVVLVGFLNRHTYFVRTSYSMNNISVGDDFTPAVIDGNIYWISLLLLHLTHLDA